MKPDSATRDVGGGVARWLPRFRKIEVSTTDITLGDDAHYEGIAFVVGWLGMTFEIQFARRHQ